MVSIPSANMNGGLKAANSSSGTVVGVGVGVTGTVLTNAQRVFLTPASSYHLAAAARQTAVGVGSAASGAGGVGVVATAKVSNSNTATSFVGNSTANAVASTSGAGGTVRYFSQFGKLQPVQQLNASVGQRKLLNGDTMVLVNGNKPLIFTTPTNNNNNNNISNINNNNGKLLATTTTAATIAATTTVPNGNRVFINKQQQLLQQQQQQLQQQQQKQQQQPSTVIDDQVEVDEVDDLIEEHNDEDDVIEIKQQQREQQREEQPLALLTGTGTTTTTTTTTTTKCTDPDAEPELDIVINNVVCSFSVRCHLKLREIALNGANVEYRRENGMVTMKLRRPYTTASIWSSGRITCTGATSESQAKIAARRYARVLNKLGFPTHFQNFRIVNVLGTCSMPWAIKIVNFSERHRDNASYEPELHPGVTYKMREPKATLKIFSTGSITVTAASVNDVESAIQHIYPLVHEFRKQRSAEELQHLRQKQRAQGGGAAVDELELQLAADAKNAAKDDIFVNTTAAHTNATRPPGVGGGGVSYLPLNSVRRLDQYKLFNDMQEQTQTERRHVPFVVDGNTKGTTNITSSSSSSNNNNNNNNNNSSSSSGGGDNICANARRRATECWASKLQNKRPRYNDPSAAATAAGTAATNQNPNVTTTATATATNVSRINNVVNVVGGNTGGSFIALNKLRPQQKPLLPVDVVLKQSSSRARNAAAAVATTTTTMTTARATTTTLITTTTTTTVDGMCMKRDSFSPTDFQVDDLIEEDDDEDIDMHF
ncbi:hypothetical protein ACLKA6_015308 [Drosophila palustris]